MMSNSRLLFCMMPAVSLCSRHFHAANRHPSALATIIKDIDPKLSDADQHCVSHADDGATTCDVLDIALRAGLSLCRRRCR